MRQGLRRFPVDGGVLLFDRDSGTNVLIDAAGEQLAAPRSVQFAITNRCNLACSFCSRDTASASAWTHDTAFAMLSGLADAGVLEVAFGGGEPFAFRGFARLVRRLYDETPLAVSATTNGLLVTRDVLAELAGAYGQLRLSLYDDNAWRDRVRMFADAGARFGVNYLVTPDRMASLTDVVCELAALGCRDVLLLSYNGRDRALHVTDGAALATTVQLLSRALPGVRIALDVCWGERLEAVPRLFAKGDCGAGREFLVVTSDQRVMPCSFHHVSYPAATADEVMAVWREGRMGMAARDPGCARTKGFGL